MATNNKLKHLERRLEGTVNEVKNLREERSILVDKIRRGERQEESIKKEINELKSQEKGIIVSEHAILRYFERVLNFNLEEIRTKILPEWLMGRAKMLGNGTYPNENYKLKVRDSVVVTIITDD